ncbi:MAG: alpha/beta hydrolase [Acidimicrobiales bacterium]
MAQPGAAAGPVPGDGAPAGKPGAGRVPALTAPDEELVITTDDGLQLRGWWWRSPSPARGAVVVAHGFAASTEDGDVMALAADLRRAGLDVLAYDSRGHGRSEGRCTVGDRERLDVAAASAASSAAAGRPVVLLGVSMGAIATLGYAATRRRGDGGPPIAGVVLVSAPARWRMSPSPVSLAMVAMTRTRPGRWFMARAVRVRVQRDWSLTAPPLTLVGRGALPMAFVHGARDRLIHPRDARLLYGRAQEPRWLDIVPDMGHGLDQPGRRAAVRAVEWVLRNS